MFGTLLHVCVPQERIRSSIPRAGLMNPHGEPLSFALDTTINRAFVFSSSVYQRELCMMLPRKSGRVRGQRKAGVERRPVEVIQAPSDPPPLPSYPEAAQTPGNGPQAPIRAHIAGRRANRMKASARKQSGEPAYRDHFADCEAIPDSAPLAERVRATVDWIGRLKVTQGDGAGENFKVLAWQRQLIESLLRDGTTQLGLSIARGNGKTTFASMVLGAYFIGPLRQPRGNVYLVASTIQQGQIALEHLISALQLEDYADRFRVNYLSNANCHVQDRRSNVTVRVLSSNPRSAHGIAPVLILGDEPAQWHPNRAEAMHSVLRTSLGKIPGSRLVCLGTRPESPDHFFSRLLKKPQSINHYAPLSEFIPDKDDPEKGEWREIPKERLHEDRFVEAANPSLSALPTLRAQIQADYEDALAEPSLLAAYKALRLNGGTSDVTQNSLLDAENVVTCESVYRLMQDGRKGAYVLGLDLGGGTAMSGASAYWPVTGLAETFAMFPSEPDVIKRGSRDGVGGLYQSMVTEGSLLLSPGKTVDYALLLANCIQRWERPHVITCDRWRKNELSTALLKVGLGNVSIVYRGQGFKDGAEDVRLFRRAALEGNLGFPATVLLRSALAESRTISDPAGNEKLARGSDGGRRYHAKDDAVASLILAVAFGFRDYQNARKLRIAV